MRLPKTVQISGKIYKITKDPSRWGASCRTGSQKIVIGTAKNQSLHRRFTNFTHEVLEAVALERRLRYEAGDDEIMFVMTHKQFDDYAKDVATAFMPLVRI